MEPTEIKAFLKTISDDRLIKNCHFSYKFTASRPITWSKNQDIIQTYIDQYYTPKDQGVMTFYYLCFRYDRSDLALFHYLAFHPVSLSSIPMPIGIRNVLFGDYETGRKKYSFQPPYLNQLKDWCLEKKTSTLSVLQFEEDAKEISYLETLWFIYKTDHVKLLDTCFSCFSDSHIKSLFYHFSVRYKDGGKELQILTEKYQQYLLRCQIKESLPKHKKNHQGIMPLLFKMEQYSCNQLSFSDYLKSTHSDWLALLNDLREDKLDTEDKTIVLAHLKLLASQLSLLLQSPSWDYLDYYLLFSYYSPALFLRFLKEDKKGNQKQIERYQKMCHYVNLQKEVEINRLFHPQLLSRWQITNLEMEAIITFARNNDYPLTTYTIPLIAGKLRNGTLPSFQNQIIKN